MSGTEAALQAGRAALLAGDPWTAVEILEEFAARDPANAEVRYWLASAKLTSGDPNGAALAMEDARILQTFPLVTAMGATRTGVGPTPPTRRTPPISSMPRTWSRCRRWCGPCRFRADR